MKLIECNKCKKNFKINAIRENLADTYSNINKEENLYQIYVKCEYCKTKFISSYENESIINKKIEIENLQASLNLLNTYNQKFKVIEKIQFLKTEIVNEMQKLDILINEIIKTNNQSID